MRHLLHMHRCRCTRAPLYTSTRSHVHTSQVQNAFKAMSTNSRTLTITLYLTGCKPEQLAPEANPKPGSTAELIKALQASAVS